VAAQGWQLIPKDRSQPEPVMSIARSVAEILGEHVTLELESIDRMYLNVYVGRLQREAGVASFFRFHRKHRFASSVLMEPISQAFVQAIERFAAEHELEVVSFRKHERKDDVAARYLKTFTGEEGVLFIGKAQEKTAVLRTERRHNPKTGANYPWLVRSTAMVNHFYVYAVDRDFGPFFLKFCSYFPYNAKLCINGHEWLKRQLRLRDIDYQALDNGILSCAQPARAQALAQALSADKIDALLRKWLHRLPHPFSRADRAAGYRYELSIVQAEFSLTQVLDRPLTGRAFFEQVIRENLDIGRPDQAQLIFARRVNRRTPGQFRTRVITEGVIPSLHVDYKSSRIKQYHKEGRALRTETTINNTRDFGIGKRLHHLPALRSVGFQANRRLLEVQTVSHDCAIGEDAFEQVVRPIEVDGQRATALRFGDTRTQALFHALVLFSVQTQGFNNAQLRSLLLSLLGQSPEQFGPGRMSYDLRRLRLHGLIQRIPKTNRYQLTAQGLKVAMLFSRTYTRLLRPALAEISDPISAAASPLRTAFDRLQSVIDQRCAELKLAA
jgi:hypothetical protein